MEVQKLPNIGFCVHQKIFAENIQELLKTLHFLTTTENDRSFLGLCIPSLN